MLANALEEYLVRHRVDPEPSFSGHDLQSGDAVEGNDSGDSAPPRRRARVADAIEEYVARQRNDPESSGSAHDLQSGSAIAGNDSGDHNNDDDVDDLE